MTFEDEIRAEIHAIRNAMAAKPAFGSANHLYARLDQVELRLESYNGRISTLENESEIHAKAMHSAHKRIDAIENTLASRGHHGN